MKTITDREYRILVDIADEAQLVLTKAQDEGQYHKLNMFLLKELLEKYEDFE